VKPGSEAWQVKPAVAASEAEDGKEAEDQAKLKTSRWGRAATLTGRDVRTSRPAGRWRRPGAGALHAGAGPRPEK